MPSDKRVQLVWEREGKVFEKRLNDILAEGSWRVAVTEVSHCDSDYFAMLIQAEDRDD